LVCSAQMRQIIIVLTLRGEDVLKADGPLYQTSHLFKPVYNIFSK
jgi:hypothetical protein